MGFDASPWFSDFFFQRDFWVTPKEKSISPRGFQYIHTSFLLLLCANRALVSAAEELIIQHRGFRLA